jgi:hypothetical protein
MEEWSRQLSRGGGGVRRGRILSGAAAARESVRQEPGANGKENDRATVRALQAGQVCGHRHVWKRDVGQRAGGQGRGGLVETWRCSGGAGIRKPAAATIRVCFGARKKIIYLRF